MSEDNAPLTVTLKAGTGFNDPWIVVRGDSPDDVTMKLDNLSAVIASTIEAANLFQGAGKAAPLVQNSPALAQGSSFGGGDHGLNAPPKEQPKAAWGQAAPAHQQAVATGPRGERLHPEGRTCDICPNVLMEKKTQTGKLKWQCEAWRWNNGNPNGHTAEFQN